MIQESQMQLILNTVPGFIGAVVLEQQNNFSHSSMSVSLQYIHLTVQLFYVETFNSIPPM